jgi:hypothetical protein
MLKNAEIFGGLRTAPAGLTFVFVWPNWRQIHDLNFVAPICVEELSGNSARGSLRREN